jgi:hypothetical protein
MSAAAVVLPFVWATAPLLLVPREPIRVSHEPIAREMAFYRKYTEGMLRRYLRMSMEAGKVPSLLGKEMFRGKVTSYRVESFEDSVIFVHDVERCLVRLDVRQQTLISRIGIQQYTIEETAELLRMQPKTIARRYNRAIDRLTRVFLDVRLLEPLKKLSRGQALQ